MASSIFNVERLALLFARPALGVTLLLSSAGVARTPGPAPTIVNRIADAAYNHGELIDTIEYLSDVIGPRLPNSPGMRKAESWTQEKFRAWGLQNVHAEGFEFGRGWWIESSGVRITGLRDEALTGIPLTWTPPTHGTLRAPIIVAPMARARDFDQWRGKLAGKIVLISYPRPAVEDSTPTFERFTDDQLQKLDRFDQEFWDPKSRLARARGNMFERDLDNFLFAEGAVGWVRMSPRDGRRLHGDLAVINWKRGSELHLPAIELTAEDYRKVARLLVRGSVQLEMNNNVHFEDSNPLAYNIIADLPGSDPNGGYVLAGAHLDSWIAGDGAADNGAGSAVVMEAARILSSLGVRPRRTIRFALWNGEEEGALGSFAYIDRHVAKRPKDSDPTIASLWPWNARHSFPVTPLADHPKLSVYFNLDNGTGRIRGIYTEGNSAVVPIFKDWFAALAGFGASTVANRPAYSTDHVLFSRAGIPAFEFIQDPLDYETRVHHSDLDTFDHLNTDDLRQAAVVMATFLLYAADSPQPMPRWPLLTQPKLTDPFRYEDPDNPERN